MPLQQSLAAVHVEPFCWQTRWQLPSTQIEPSVQSESEQQAPSKKGIHAPPQTKLPVGQQSSSP
jgi:hypothetical protein